MKQTHRKVRSGCIACKKRRIKCDELKPQCSYCLRQIAKNRQLYPCCYPEGSNLDIASTSSHQDESVPSPTSSNCLSTISQYGWPTAIPAVEKRLLQHICHVRSDLDNIIDLGLFAGATQWNGFMPMAGYYDHLRFCMCSIAAGHLRTLYKSTTEHEVECRFRTNAIREMAMQLNAVLASPQQEHKESSQALLASTILMAWYSNTRHEYEHLLNGVFALWPKCSGSFLLEHFNTLEPPINLSSLPQDPQNGDLLPEHDYRLLNIVADSFHQLSACDLDDGLRVAVKEMSNFIFNARSFLLSPKGPRDNTFSIMFPVRNWLRIVPRAPEELSKGSFLVLLYLSNYETAMLLMGILCPLINLPLAIETRYTGVLKLQDYIQTALEIYITRTGYTRQTANIQKATRQWILASNMCLESYNNSTMP